MLPDKLFKECPKKPANRQLPRLQYFTGTIRKSAHKIRLNSVKKSRSQNDKDVVEEKEGFW